MLSFDLLSVFPDPFSTNARALGDLQLSIAAVSVFHTQPVRRLDGYIDWSIRSMVLQASLLSPTPRAPLQFLKCMRSEVNPKSQAIFANVEFL